MAKYKVGSSIVPFASVVWFREYNGSRPSGNYGTEAEVKNTLNVLTDQDWVLDNRGIIKVEELTEDLVKRALAEREQAWEYWKTQAKLDPTNQAVRLQVWEELYTVGGKKLIVPEFLGIDGNRRAQVAFEAKVARWLAKQPMSKELNVQICTFENPLQRLLMQVADNDQATSGKLEISNVDRILAAQKVFRMGGIEADLSKSFKRGMAQKLWAIVTLDNQHPGIGIVERMALPPEHENFISWGVDKEDMRNLALRSDATALAKKNATLTTAGKSPLLPATEAEVEAYFKSPKANGSNKPKIMAREHIEAMSTNHAITIVKETAKAVMTNNQDIVAVYIPYPLLINGITEMVKVDPDGAKKLEFVVAKIMAATNGERKALIQKLIDAAS